MTQKRIKSAYRLNKESGNDKEGLFPVRKVIASRINKGFETKSKLEQKSKKIANRKRNL